MYVLASVYADGMQERKNNRSNERTKKQDEYDVVNQLGPKVNKSVWGSLLAGSWGLRLEWLEGSSTPYFRNTVIWTPRIQKMGVSLSVF